MAELFWDDSFEWIEPPTTISKEDAANLSIEQKVSRELQIAKILPAFRGRWVLRAETSEIITSAGTLGELLPRINGRDGVMHYVSEDSDGFYLAA